MHSSDMKENAAWTGPLPTMMILHNPWDEPHREYPNLMADPLSITGLVIELGSILKGLYEYGKKVKGAQSQIASLCSELVSSLESLKEIIWLTDFQAALQSILTDLEGSMPDLAQAEFTTMRSMATALVNGLTARLEIKSG